MLTIGQLAALVGVTVRAIRHYHQRGLLPEPERDASGYRRYDAGAAITLTRIRTLAEAGVPIARIPALLDAPPADLQATVDDLDARLAERIEALHSTRRRLRDLCRPDLPDAAFLPAPVADHLQRLRDIGLDEDAVALERDGWTLTAVLHPGEIDRWIAQKNALLDDPAAVELYRRVHDARDREPGDPLLADLADEIADLIRRLDRPTPPGAAASYAAPLLASYAATMSPAWTSLETLVSARLGPRDGRPG
jgi:DNA-binding transcriptional MerR regulator